MWYRCQAIYADESRWETSVIHLKHDQTNMEQLDMEHTMEMHSMTQEDSGPYTLTCLH